MDDPYLELAVTIRKRVRWLVAALAAVALGSVLMTFGQINRMSEEADHRYRFLAGEARARYTQEALEAVKRPEGLDDLGRPIVSVSKVPTLDRDLFLHVRQAMPEEKYGLFGVETSAEVFVGVVVLVPGALLIALIAALRQEVRLHHRLASQARDESEIQLRLNSLYFERVTERYLAGWKRHVWAGGLAVLALAVLPVILVSSRSSLALDTRIAVDAEGVVYPANENWRETPLVPTRNERVTLFLGSVLIVNIALWCVLMWYALWRIPRAGTARAAARSVEPLQT